MIKILDRRQKGKTTKLIKLSANTRYPMIVRDQLEVKNVQSLAAKMKVSIPRPISIYDILDDKEQARYIDKVIIDNAEEILTIIIKSKISLMVGIEAISINIEERKTLLNKIRDLFKGGFNK